VVAIGTPTPRTPRVEQDYGGETRLIALGPARDGALLELVPVPGDVPIRVIHADHARRSFLDRLR